MSYKTTLLLCIVLFSYNKITDYYSCDMTSDILHKYSIELGGLQGHCSEII